MLNLKKVAVTGGLASGKTTVCRILKDLGAYVVSADTIVHRLLTPDSEVGQQVIELLGNGIVVDGTIDRSRIARQVFNHPGKLKRLEEILHPLVLKTIKREYELAVEDKSALFVVEIPLLYEVGWEPYFDEVITTYASDELCWQRFRAKTGYSREEFDSRMRRQMSPSAKGKKSRLIIRNEGTQEELRDQVNKLYQELTTNP